METENALVLEKAREAMDRSKGDREAAKRLLRKWVDDDAKVRSALIAPLIDGAIDQAIRNACHGIRAALITRADRGTVPDDVGLRIRAMHNLEGLLSYPLPGPHQNKCLGEAVKAEIAEAANYHAGQRRGHGAKERWFRLIHQALKDSQKPVKRQLSNEDLRNMLTRAEKEEQVA